jgi:hypothetical protein
MGTGAVIQMIGTIIAVIGMVIGATVWVATKDTAPQKHVIERSVEAK